MNSSKAENLQQQRPQAVDRPGAFVGQIGVQSGEHLQCREHFAVPVNGVQGARHGPCRFGEDERIRRVRLGFP